LWTAATAGGWLLGTSINYLFSLVLSMTELGAALDADAADIAQSTILVFMAISLVMLLLVGLSVGVLQWLLLRRHLAGLQQWAIFTGLGFALGSFAFLAFMGVGAGLMQWLLLRRNLNKTGWWPVMSAVAWPVGYMLGGSLGAALGTAVGSPYLGGLLGAALTGVIIGAITGAVLLWLLRENRVLLGGLRAEAEQAQR
jgi:hypothetical protein